MKKKIILLIGGYGLAGRNITHLLLEYTSASVILGGRNRDKAQQTAEYFNNLYSGSRAQGVLADIRDADSVKTAIAQCDLVIDCIPLNTGTNSLIAGEALKKNINYINLNISKQEREKLTALYIQSGEPDLHLLTHCGIFPGLPSALTGLAASRFDKLNKVMIGMIGSSEEGSVNSAEEMISADLKSPFLFRNNTWQKSSMSASRKIDFGPPFGTRKCFLCNLEETEDLPSKFNIEEFELYAAETNVFTMMIIVLWNLLKLNKFKHSIKSGAKLINWGVKRFAGKPFGITLKMEASGEKNGKDCHLDVFLFCSNVYKSTAIATAACIIQVISGNIKKPGVSYMGQAVNSDKLLADMEKMGMSIDIRWD